MAMDLCDRRACHTLSIVIKRNWAPGVLHRGLRIVECQAAASQVTHLIVHALSVLRAQGTIAFFDRRRPP